MPWMNVELTICDSHKYWYQRYIEAAESQALALSKIAKALDRIADRMPEPARTQENE